MNIKPTKTTGRPRGLFRPDPKAKLREQLPEVCRFKQFSLRTETAYWNWIQQYLRFHRDRPHLTPTLSPPAAGAEREKCWRHPREMGAGG